MYEVHYVKHQSRKYKKKNTRIQNFMKKTYDLLIDSVYIIIMQLVNIKYKRRKNIYINKQILFSNKNVKKIRILEIISFISKEVNVSNNCNKIKIKTYYY
jgi:hypothetical protein